MKGNVVDIYKAFDGADKKLVIPVYQRNYDWTVKQCERLFDDIVDMIEQGRPKHFFGAVVGDHEDSFTWVVIDGQQRMTTVSLLMLALVHVIEAGDIVESGEEGDSRGSSGLARKLVNNYLTIGEGDEQKFKLKPVKDDANAYAKLFGPESRFIEESKITANYRYFRQRLKNSKFTAQTLWDKGICQLEVMLLDLEDHDDPQRIFESLNSTGLALKESDKIRNLVLMGLAHKEQNRLYEQFWNPMEINVEFKTDHFVRWYLVAQTAKTPKQGEVFDFFKRFISKSPVPASRVVEDMFAFSEIEKELSKAATGYRAINRRLRQANLVLGDVVKPFLWLTYRDMKNGEITPDDFTEIVSIIESYVFRRVVSAVAANALNKIFASAYADLRKMRKNGEPYSEILAYMLSDRGQSGRFPSDREFGEAFRTRDFYRFRPAYRAYTFDCLEIGHSKDVKDIAGYIASGDLTVEHIMPQTLNQKWREALGPQAKEIHDEWVNRIANLTITGYNSEYSNRTFQQKKEMEGGFGESPYGLNNFVKNQEKWGLEELEQRADLLVSRALKTWKMSKVTFEPPTTAVPSMPLSAETNFTGESVVAVELEGTKTAVKTWGDALVAVLSELLAYDREGVLSMIEKEEALLLSQEDMAKAEITIDESGAATGTAGGWRNSRIIVIDPALGVRVNNSTSQKVGLMRRVCDGLDYSTDEILFYLRGHRKNEDSPNSLKAPAAEDSPEETGPYSDLVALKPLVDELVGSTLTENQTEEVRTSLIDRMEGHMVEQPHAVLGGKSLEVLLNERVEGALTSDEALAGLSTILMMSTMMGPSVIHSALLNGQVSRLLGELA
nr:DUF262 domain-containing protein [Corynebacterium lactis]